MTHAPLLLDIRKSHALCKYNGQGCAKEDTCRIKQRHATGCCYLYKYFEFLDNFSKEVDV